MDDDDNDGENELYPKAMRDSLRAGDRDFVPLWRAAAAFPIADNSNVRAFQSSLERRWKMGDPNVIAYFEGEDGETLGRFELAFSKQDREYIEREYIVARSWEGFMGGDDERAFDARLFVKTIESHAAWMPIRVAIEPPNQKDRQRAIVSAANAFDRLVDSLNGLDSAALGWVFACVEHAMTDKAKCSPFPGVSYRVLVEAGEDRKTIDALARLMGPAIRSAAKTLPKIERNANDPRLHAAFFLERLMQEHGLGFGVTETSFAAQCLRAMLKLAGYLDENTTETDRVSYWLKKVSSSPADEVPWFGAFRKS